MTMYTLVQHTGWSVAHKPAFKFAVEERGIDAELTATIIKKGGVIFASYRDASNAAIKYNYPPNQGGLYPKVEGSFLLIKKLNEKIFIPKDKVGDITELPVGTQGYVG